MNRIAPSPARPINWRALNAAGNFGPGRYPRDRLSSAWLVMLLIGLALLAAANELGAFR